MAQLREAVEKRKDHIIRALIAFNYSKHEDGRQLYELPLAELERLYINMRIEKCRFIPHIKE
ncbi:MAG: Fur-regulated basic protein FbpA [Bacillus sp. (in: Bacteria)]|nr:Fur-regulated basic protein FbpA [Bacillus sp. (in: firmicutes)]